MVADTGPDQAPSYCGEEFAKLLTCPPMLLSPYAPVPLCSDPEGLRIGGPSFPGQFRQMIQPRFPNTVFSSKPVV